jgi:hypothetical protein
LSTAFPSGSATERHVFSGWAKEHAAPAEKVTLAPGEKLLQEMKRKWNYKFFIDAE